MFYFHDLTYTSCAVFFEFDPRFVIRVPVPELVAKKRHHSRVHLRDGEREALFRPCKFMSSESQILEIPL